MVARMRSCFQIPSRGSTQPSVRHSKLNSSSPRDGRLESPWLDWKPLNSFLQAQQHQQHQQQQHDGDKKRKETILDLSKYLDKPIRVKFAGGREASGVLKGYDPLLNLVLDGTTEYLRDPDDQFKLAEDTRSLGLVVCRGTSVVLICPMEGMESISNPFIQQES